jgi:hypothetical protein
MSSNPKPPLAADPRGDIEPDGAIPDDPFADLAPDADGPFSRWFTPNSASSLPQPAGQSQCDEPAEAWDEDGLYARAQELLVAILKKDGQDPARAERILYQMDRAWRFEDRTISYKLHRREITHWEEFRKEWVEHTRRGDVSFDAFARLKGKLGPRKAASKASKLWNKPIKRHPGEAPVKPYPVPMLVWETRIGEALISELELQLGRPLKFSRHNAGAGPVGGPDLSLLVELFAVAKAERAAQGDSDEAAGPQAPEATPAVEGNPDRKRNPGSKEWCAHMIERRRTTTRSQR